MSAALDAAAGDPYYTQSLAGDYRDTEHMGGFTNPTAAPAGNWWEGVIQYGLTRAIDNRFSRPNVTGNVQPGSFAGQNGQTYLNTPAGAGAGGVLGGIPMWAVIAAVGVVAVVVLAK